MAIEARPRLTLDDILVIDADVHAHEQPDQMLLYTDPPWREALANVAKHSLASRVQVRVLRDRKLLRVEVEDNGIGGAHPAKGHGLAGLVDRLTAVDGTLIVDSPPGGPTRLIAEIPCALS